MPARAPARSRLRPNGHQGRRDGGKRGSGRDLYRGCAPRVCRTVSGTGAHLSPLPGRSHGIGSQGG